MTTEQPLRRSIIDFCRKKIQQDEIYARQHFKNLLDLAKMESVERPTKPGRFSNWVSENNTGETAFQRALYNHPNANLVIVRDALRTKLSFKDIELPITFSAQARRRCVDLIGQAAIHRTFFCERKFAKSDELDTFLCELKYAKSDGLAPAGNSADYAVFQALLYYFIIKTDYDKLDKQKVCREGGRGFSWKAVSESGVILVLANDYFWTNACRSPDFERISKLLEEIGKSLDIKILLCSAPNYPFFKREDVVEGKYKPQLTRCDYEGSVGVFPNFRLIASID
jgi:hypothetical protein